MCGIFAYTGDKKAQPILLEGLQSLEYRGYDSAGIFMPGSPLVKTPGAVTELRQRVHFTSDAKSGIAHLRWATHGEPTEVNAHPHADCTGDVYVAHNGIIENFNELKEELKKRNHEFKSDTDTEVLAHMIEEGVTSGQSFEDAVVATLGKIRGTYGLLISYAKEPGTVITARMGSPVVLGLGDGENFVASDATPILRHTKQVVFLSDGDVAIITPNSHRVRTLSQNEINRPSETVDWNAEEASKGGYPHFMLKEIMEIPEVIENAIRGRIVPKEGRVKLGGLEAVETALQGVDRVILTACGGAYIVGLLAEYMLEHLARIPVEVEFGSEFRYRHPVVSKGTALLAISQSGETLDTLEAVREAKRHGALTLGVVNTVGSSIARETDAGVYNHAGPEIGVASTKAVISQITVMTLITLFLGRTRGLAPEEAKKIINALQALPDLARKVLALSEEIRKVALKYKDARDFLYIGRRWSYPVALEGALKIKEISYVHAEGYSAGEMKHGPLALIDEKFPTFVILPKDSVYEKTLSNMIEIKARKGPLIALVTEGDVRVKDIANDVMYIPETHEALSPILSMIVVQLFAYHFAAEKGFNVDRPRNLAKSVTVE